MTKPARTPAVVAATAAAAGAQWSMLTTRTPIATGRWMFLITLGIAIIFSPRDATAGAAITASNSIPQMSFVELGFSEEPSDSAVAENAPVVLHCAAFSTPHVGNPQIRWHKDGLPVELDEKRHRLHANGSLYLNSVQRRGGHTDEGEYHCLASLPDVGTIISKPARLVITYSIPTFEEQPQNVSLYAGQTAFFPCFVSQDRAHRSPRVTWLRNGAPLRLDPLKMVQLPSGALEIDALAAHDEGQYQCQVTTGDKVRLSSVGSLKVLPTPQPGSVENERRVPTAPVFIAQPSQVRAVKGDQVTLDCAANGHPRPHISWLKDGASIDMSNLDSRFRLVGVGSLQIESVQPQDAGSYMCRAENREDSLDASATLTVLVPPTFRAKPAPQAVREKEDALFECDVFGVPEPKVQWFKNGESVLITGYFQLVNGHNLRILGSVHNDRGVYQCVAENQAGTAQASAQLVVLDKGGSPGSAKEAPSAPRGLTAQLVTANIISLSWQPPQHNADGIITYTVLYKAEESTRERVQNTTQHKLDEIIIKNLKPSTKYYFRVVAVDELHGMGEYSEPIAVETNADIANNVVGPPLNVRANPMSTSQIAVTWEPPVALPPRTKINYYEVYYQEMSASSFAHEEQKMTSRTSSLTLDNLTTFAEYTIWVNAVTPNGTGVSSSEVVARTFSDTPSESPQNVTLETSNGGTSLIVRWEPPPREQQNGVLTGYKIRYKQGSAMRDRRKGETITTDGNRRSYTLESLNKNEVYMVKIAALTVNGTGPATDWISTDSYRAEPEENNVPDQPSHLRTKSSSRSITVGWLPPRDTNIMVRGYRIGWGPGIPDLHTSKLEGKQRFFTMENLQPMTEYVISVRAYNRIGEGQSLQDTVRTLPEVQVAVPASLVPPVGLKAVVLSPTTVVLFWSDTTVLSGQTNGNRQYQVRYKAVSSSKYKFANSTQLNCMIDELRPFTQYEFAVRVVLRGRRESGYSMTVFNTTHEAVPENAPRDFTIDEDSEPGTVTLHWGPPKVSNGIITSYSIVYTTEPSLKDRDWLMEVVSGDKLTTSIGGLHTDNRYYFKIYANTSKGAGPMSDAVTHHTGKSFQTTILGPNTTFGGLLASNITLLVGAGAGLVLLLLVLTACALPCRKKDPATTQSSRKDKTSKMVAGTTSLGDEKPPDLWIHHHDQMELKTCKGANLPPDGVTSNRNSQDVSSIEDHYMGTLDKKKSLYMDSGASDSGGSGSCRTDRPLLPKYPTSNHSRPTSVDPALKPLLYSSPSIEPGSSATLGRPYHQRASNQYSTGPRAHIMMEPLPHHIDGLTTLSRHHPLPSSTYEAVVPPLPGVMTSHGHTLGGHGSQLSGGGQVPSYTSALLAANAAAAASLASQQHQQPPPPPPPHIMAGYDTIGRQQRSAQGAAGFNQMRSFSVPSGGQGGPSTPPPPKHVVVRPQPSSAGSMMHNSGSPQKGVNTSGSGGPQGMKRVLVPNGAAPGLRDDLNYTNLQTPFNEELDAQMANLDCLMKDLNGVIISSSEFEC